MYVAIKQIYRTNQSTHVTNNIQPIVLLRCDVWWRKLNFSYQKRAYDNSVIALACIRKIIIYVLAYCHIFVAIAQFGAYKQNISLPILMQRCIRVKSIMTFLSTVWIS